MITICTMAYNESVMMQFMISHYRIRFPNCRIIVFDNQSTDNTKQIALDNSCEVVDFNTNNQVNDFKIRELKNNFWKVATTDWVCVCDPDELVDINEADLINESIKNTTIIKPEGYQMVNMEDNFDLKSMKWGARATQYDKLYIFNKKMIKEINYSCGCHSANPSGIIKYNDTLYKMYHYKCINHNYMISRYRLTAGRLSEENKRNKMGDYVLNPDYKIIKDFEDIKRSSTKILEG